MPDRGSGGQKRAKVPAEEENKTDHGSGGRRPIISEFFGEGYFEWRPSPKN